MSISGPARDRPRRFSPVIESRLTLGLLLAVCSSFSLLLVTSYFPITEGWFQDISNYLSRGLVMYRDFHMFVPPGFIYLMHIISVLTNDSVLAMRLYGIGESVVLIIAAFAIMRRLFSPRVSFVAILTAFVLYTANVQNVFYGYYQSSLVLALISLYLAVRCHETFPGGIRFPILFGLISGFLLLFKQSTGLVLPIAIGLTLLALSAKRDRARALRNAGASAVAYLLVVMIVATVLAASGALIPALDQVLGGSSSKGGLGAVLVGFLGHIPIAGTLVLVVATIATAIFARLSSQDPMPRPENELLTVATIGACAVAMFVWLRFVPGPYIDVGAARDQRQNVVYAAFFLVALLGIYLAGTMARGNRGDRPIRLLVCVAAFTIMYIHGMSAVLEEHALFLPAALLIGVALSSPVAWPRARDAGIYVACAGLLFTVTVQRNAMPYHWWGVNGLEPTWSATSTFSDPHLAGLHSSPAYTRDLNAIYELFKSNARAGDTMYSFPHINYFNVMAELPSPTFGRVDYFDVAPDGLAVRDAELLRQHPPTFLVWMELTPAEWTTHEAIFRGGRASGQREIQRVVNELISSESYQELGRFTLGASDPILIYMFKRTASLAPGRLDQISM